MDEPVFIKLDIPVVGFSDSSFQDRGGKWKAETLCDAAEDLPEFDLPLAGIDLSVMPWNIRNFFNIVEHMNRVVNADMTYPIILDDFGYICDGWHRLAKALLQGKTHIRAKRLASMPEPDEVYEEEQKS